MDILEMIRHRRSIRQYTGEAIPDEILEKILQAGLLAPSSRNIRPWEYIVVRDKDTLQKLSTCRPAGPQMLASADAAIIVLCKTEGDDVWTEDGSIAMTLMHLTADALGVGSCWIQGRLRMAPDGGTAEDYLRRLLGIPEGYALEAILSLGMPAVHPEEKKIEEADFQKIHCERW